MQFVRPAFAIDSKHFGKGRMRELAAARPAPSSLRDDLKLFATTFLAGFVVVSILIG